LYRPIIINACHLGARPTGIGIYALELLREWAVRPGGFRFTVYVHETAKPLIDGFASEHFSPRAVSARWFPKNANFRRFLFANLLAAAERKAVVFHASQFEAAFTGARQIVTIHDLIPLQTLTTRLQRFYYRNVLPRSLARSAAVIAPSQATADALQRSYRTPASKIRVIPHGVRAFSTDAQPIKPVRPYILFAGRLTPYRNLDRLVSAFLSIRDRVEHDLVIAGEATPGFRLSAPDPRIRLTGFVDDEMLGALYRGASLFVFPSHAEGFGFPPLEAMLCGTPVITSREASLPEVCGSAAWFVDPHSADSIGEGILRVLLDQRLQAQLRDAGKRRASELTWRASAERHLQVFAEIGSETTGRTV
jgi:glycosyltransferase involved in cell wall biosynthesis